MDFLEHNSYHRIELEAHTDCRGSHAYNQQLSKRRVSSVADWLVSKEILNDKITRLYKGEEDPEIKCDPCNSCNEKKHQLNRRVEVKVWK
jgi:outer membrane protein OmpA-like peptidoglycan-associated protein